jgi:hypothetical protein
MINRQFDVNSFAYLAIFLMGFQQFFAPRIGTTKIDITCAVFVVFLIVYAVKVGFKKQLYIIAFALNSFWFSINISYLYSDFSRIIFTCFLLTALFFLFTVPKIHFSHIKFKKYIDWMLIYTILAVFSQIFTGNMRNSRIGFFDEPSFLGLVLFSAASGYLGSILHQWSKKDFIKFFLLFMIAFSTQSMHVVSFILPLLIYFTYKVISGRGLKLSFFLIFLATVSGAAYWFFGFQFVDLEHFIERLNLIAPTNLSLLSWLRGLDQAIYAAKNSFVFGFGPGSTGEFDFPSKYTGMLAIRHHENLNLADAYSAFFRMTIEMGFVVTLIIVIIGVKIFLVGAVTKDVKMSRDSVFILWFGFTLLIGVMIKEPTYSRSYVFVSVFLLGQFRKGWYLRTPKK